MSDLHHIIEKLTKQQSIKFIGIFAALLVSISYFSFKFNRDFTNSAQAATTVITTKVVNMNPQLQKGTVTLSYINSASVQVAFSIAAAGFTNQPAQIVAGTCAAPGALLYQLNSVVNGASTTVLPVSLDTLLAKKSVIVVQKSAAESNIYTSCGVVSSVNATPTPIPPTATLAPTIVTQPSPTGTTSSTGENSMAMGLWKPNPKFDNCYNADGSINADATSRIVALHDSFKVRGPDGKWYPTWHPPTAVDPKTGATCRFGHEHGRDPKLSYLWQTKQIQKYFYYDANKNGVMDPDEEAVSGIPFGYANEQLDAYNAARGVTWMRHEDHMGHKVEFANGEGDTATDQENNLLTGGVNVQHQTGGIVRTGVKCYYLAKVHQGVSSPDAFTNNVHEVVYFADCFDPNNPSNNETISTDQMMVFGRVGGFTKFMPLCGIQRRDDPQDFVNLGTDANNVNFPSVPSSQGDREIITRDCIEKGFLVPSGQWSGNLYEAWPASLGISDTNGKMLASGINLLFDVEDANRYFYPEDMKIKNGYNNPDAKTNLGFTMDLCYDKSLLSQGRIYRGGPCDYATNYGQITNITWDDPRSAFKGLHRGMYFQPAVINNAGGSEIVYSDPFGKNARTTPFVGSIKQQVSAKNLNYGQIFNLTIDPRVVDREHDSGGNTVHAPN